jgi:hypothetical protein
MSDKVITLSVTTNQEAFDAVVRHLASMNRQSVVIESEGLDPFGEPLSGSCAYRHPDGRKCAIGALIPDDQYDPIIEKSNVWSLVTGLRSGTPRLDAGTISTDLLINLQDAHDDWNNWDRTGFNRYNLLEAIGKWYDLDTTVLKEVQSW